MDDSHASTVTSADPSTGFWIRTQTTVIRQAQARTDDPQLAQAALGDLCLQYQAQIESYIRRRRRESYNDLTQSFLLHLLDKGIGTYDRTRGRFRTWLQMVASNFLRRQRRYANAKMRDARKTLCVDPQDGAHLLERRDTSGADQRLDHARLLDAADAAWEEVRQRYAQRGKVERFDALECLIPGDEWSTRGYAEAAEALGITQDCARKAACDLRRRYREVLRAKLRALRDSGQLSAPETLALLADLVAGAEE